MSAVAFCVALGFGILAPALPVFARTFEVSNLQASAVISAFALVRLVTAPLAGGLVDRLGERIVMASGLLIVATSSAAAGLSQDYVQLVVLRGVGGLGSTMFTVSAMALLLRTVEAHQRGRAAGAYQGGFILGGVAGPAVGGAVVAWSIRAPFFVYAATLVLATVVALAFLTRTRLRDEEPHDKAVETNRLDALRAALGNRAYQAALTVNFVTGFVAFGLRSSAVPLFVTEGLQRGPSLAGVGFLVAAAFQAALLLPAGRMADTRGRRRALQIGTLGVVLGMVVMTAADAAVHGLGTAAMWGTVLFLASMAIQGVAGAFVGSAPAAVVGDIMGRRRGGIVVAAFQMTSDIGTIIGPLVAGALIDTLGFGWAFGVGAAISLTAVTLVYLMPETLTRKPAVE